MNGKQKMWRWKNGKQFFKNNYEIHGLKEIRIEKNPWISKSPDFSEIPMDFEMAAGLSSDFKKKSYGLSMD